MTRSGQILGTPSYMPPEQCEAKSGKIGRCSDVYGLGATLYHLVVGRAPFVAATVAEVAAIFEAVIRHAGCAALADDATAVIARRI